jgi:hypothetical protein
MSQSGAGTFVIMTSRRCMRPAKLMLDTRYFSLAREAMGMPVLAVAADGTAWTLPGGATSPI